MEKERILQATCNGMQNEISELNSVIESQRKELERFSLESNCYKAMSDEKMREMHHIQLNSQQLKKTISSLELELSTKNVSRFTFSNSFCSSQFDASVLYLLHNMRLIIKKNIG